MLLLLHSVHSMFLFMFYGHTVFLILYHIIIFRKDYSSDVFMSIVFLY